MSNPKGRTDIIWESVLDFCWIQQHTRIRKPFQTRLHMRFPTVAIVQASACLLQDCTAPHTTNQTISCPGQGTERTRFFPTLSIRRSTVLYSTAHLRKTTVAIRPRIRGFPSPLRNTEEQQSSRECEQVYERLQQTNSD